MQTKEILEKAYHLLDDKRRWVQHKYAGKDGRPDDTWKISAIRNGDFNCFCAAGAIIRVSERLGHIAAVKALASAIGPKIDRNYDQAISAVTFTNDIEGYASIRRAFRKAIKDQS